MPTFCTSSRRMQHFTAYAQYDDTKIGRRDRRAALRPQQTARRTYGRRQTGDTTGHKGIERDRGDRRNCQERERKTDRKTLDRNIAHRIALPYPRVYPSLYGKLPCHRANHHRNRPQVAIEKLRAGEIDVAILATPLRTDDLLEIPLYHEPFVAYFAAGSPEIETAAMLDSPPNEKLWVLHESHCERHPIFGFCKRNEEYNRIYEAGSIDTLIRIVDTNGGYTVIPAWHVQFMQPWQKENVRPFDNDKAQREISMVIRHDYVKEGLLNAIAETAKKIIPAEMLDNYLKNYKIRL